MSRLLFFCLMFVTFQEMRAVIISGKVVINGTSQPLDAASVFLNNTTIGTLTNPQGEFKLEVPEGQYKLIVTYIGYDTYNKDIEVSYVKANPLIINLVQKTYTISEVVISASAKDWEMNFDCFKKVFLGTTPNAAECKILNPYSVKLYRNKENGSLEAYSDTFILVENKALGYLIKFKLEFFISNFNESSYYGYPLFQDISQVSPSRFVMLNKREEAYKGSVGHFFRSLYYQIYEKEGFTCLKLQTVAIDTTKRYPHTILNNPLLLKKKGTQLIQTEDTLKIIEFIRDTIKDIKNLNYGEPFEVSYKKKAMMDYYNYGDLFAGLKNRRKRQTSILFIKSQNGFFDRNGVYIKGNDLLTAGYMSWKRTADMLPDNYESSR